MKTKDIKPVYEFVISRREWLRGEGSEKSCLWRRQDNKKCCMGIYARACGVAKKELLGRSTLHIFEATATSVYSRSIFVLPPEFETHVKNNKTSFDLLYKIYETNDNPKITDKVREKRLTALLKKAKIKVKFVR